MSHQHLPSSGHHHDTYENVTWKREREASIIMAEKARDRHVVRGEEIEVMIHENPLGEVEEGWRPLVDEEVSEGDEQEVSPLQCNTNLMLAEPRHTI